MSIPRPLCEYTAKLIDHSERIGPMVRRLLVTINGSAIEPAAAITRITGS
jgi:hypothetical protein